MISLKNQRNSRIGRIIRHPYFEPVASISAVAILIAALFLYTANWPPMVVVESDSMQHGPNDVLGIINTGDIVLVKKVSVPSDVNTYVASEPTGYTTYGEPGDVILYYPNGVMGSTPVIHRAILWIDYNQSTGSFDAPSLLGLSCPSQYSIETPSGTKTCLSNPWTPVTGTLNLYNVGWTDLTISIDFSSLLMEPGGPASGYITMGDNNNGLYDQKQEGKDCAISCIVQPGWVLGVARGMVPWFGALKLWLDGNTWYVPSQTWDYLALCIVLIITLPFVVPWGIRRLKNTSRGRSRAGKSPDDEPASSKRRQAP
jgi:signal peptidase